MRGFTRFKQTTALSGLAIGLTLFGLVGCEQPIAGIGGGASSPVAVTILPSAGEQTTSGTSGTVEYGSISGRIILDGTPGTLAPIVSAAQTATTNGVCVAGTIPNEKLIVGAGNGMRDVFIFLQRSPKGGKSLKEVDQEDLAPVTMSNSNCTFVPHALFVKTTQPVKILNLDGVPHNVKSNTIVGKSQNATVNPKDESGDVTITYDVGEKQPVLVECNFHSWMKAWHLPLNHPYGACTDKDGNFAIKDLPVGSHRFVMYHEGAKVLEKEVVVTKEGVDGIEIRIPVGDLKVAHAQPKTFKRVVLSTIPSPVP